MNAEADYHPPKSMASVQQVWKALEDAIWACTGLSPAVFFAAVSVAFAVYYAISGFFAHYSSPSSGTREEMESLPPPVQLGEITEEDLKAYDGSDPKKPLLMAIKGQIYDVSQSRFSSLLFMIIISFFSSYGFVGWLVGSLGGFVGLQGIWILFIFIFMGFCLFSWGGLEMGFC